MAEWRWEWSECDPAQCWVELFNIWSLEEFQGWLRSTRSPRGSQQGEDGWASTVDPEGDWFYLDGEGETKVGQNVALGPEA